MSQKENTNSEDPWLIGSQYAQVVGAPPSSFTTLIRGLLQDRERNSNTISFHQEQAMVRFLRGESMKAPFYFILKTFKHEMLAGKPIPLKQIVHAFEPMELAAYLGFLYTYRRLQNRIKNGTEWDFLKEVIIPHSEVSTRVGYAIPAIGPGSGLIGGGIRFMAFTPFLIHDEKGYVEYRRHLKKQELLSDHEYELSRWGCTHCHILTHLLIAMGFDKDTAIAIAEGLLLKNVPDKPDSSIQAAMKISELWTSALLKTGQVPDIRHSGNFYPVEEALEKLLDGVAKSRHSSSQYYWMEKKKSDINEEIAPEMFDANKQSGSKDSLNEHEAIR